MITGPAPLLPATASGCFALLDDHTANTDDPRSRLYTGHLTTLTCREPAELPAMLERMQVALRHGRHAVLVFSYELGAAMHGIAGREDDQALSQILLFERCDHLSPEQVAAWLAQQAHSEQTGIADLRMRVGEAGFNAAIARIHELIAAGDSYQVNYTFRLHFEAFGAPASLYRRLRERQPVPYGALIGLPDGQTLISLSPELFLRHTQGELLARPMKGTAAASGDAAFDTAAAEALAQDPKNRAENVMIVDLLRNDMGRVARYGSVAVPNLFEVGTYGEVLQMTSTVTAQLREDASLAEIFEALYPCGSITGAPKRRSMQIIRELEPDARGFYCGTTGWFEAAPEGRPVGDFCLSVLIRSLLLQAPRADGLRSGELGVGAGIVDDSEAASEYAESRLKAAFLTGLPQDFELFETLRASAAEGLRHRQRHLARLRASAMFFGFTWDEATIAEALDAACAALPPGLPHRLRLALGQDGRFTLQSALLQPLTTPVRLLLAETPTGTGDIFLRHKTTVRAAYDQAWKAAEAAGGFDTLFFNQHGELTEGGRSNVFVKLQGHWYTPPLACGLLPGVMRAVLLDDPAWDASERRLTLDDLRQAEQIVVCNALRGALRAYL
jgi:para-aminobenzoate synthetase/4-amino-4-deoxychorismate lyase